MSDTTSTAVIDIPTLDGYDVAVDLLNDEYDDIKNLLVDEKVPLEYYLRTAILYHNVDKTDYFHKLLNLVIEDSEVEDKYYQDNPKSLLDARTDALNILIGHLIEQYNKVKIDQFDNEKQAMEDMCDNKREELLNEINKLSGKAEQFNPSKLTNFLSRGVLHLNLGALDKAEGQFDYVLTVDKDNVLSRLGMACIKYHKKQYKEALSDFEKCLLMNPQGPADIRLGMGLCHYQLDNFERAKQCFERVLQIDPNNVSALIYLAIIDLNSRDEELLQNAVKNYLKRAYSLDPGNSQVLNMLGNHFFFRREVDKTEELVFAAFHNTKSPKIKAESCYNMARAYHHKKDYDSAFKYYYRIVSKLWPEYTLARYGLGQLYIQRNEIDKAIEEFEQILKVDPENLETNLVLGNLYARKRDSKKSLAYLKKVLKKDPENINALLRIGEHERHNIQFALDSLKQALTIVEEGETELVVTHELYNNIAVHYYKLGNNTEAEEYFKKALSLAECNVLDNLDDLQQPIDVKHLSLVYNFARFKEASKSLDDAQKLYLKIAAQHPSYINAYLRLGKIQQKNGNQDKAIHFCKLATSLEPNNPATWAFLGQTYLEQNNYTEAQKSFEYITQNIDKNDIYALLGMGNVYFKSLRTAKPNPDEKEQERIEKHLDYALLFFEKTLKLDNSNLYAALNSGCVLCENGYTEEGKSLILRVREICVGDDMKDTPETYINLGHLAMIQKQYAQAEKLYATCSKRFFNDENPMILAYLAKSLFDNNKHEESLVILKKIQEMDSTNLTIKYNIALAFYEKLVTTLNDNNKDLTKVQILEDQNQTIINLFSEIAENTNSKKNTCEFSLDEKIVVHKAKDFVTVLETKIKEKIEKYREKAEKEELAKQELKKKQEDAFKIIEEQTKKQLEDQEELRRAKEEKLRETFGRLESIKANLKTIAFEEDEDEEKKTKKRKKTHDLDDELQTEYNDQTEQQEAPAKKKRKPKEPKKNKEKKDKKETKKKTSRLKKNAKATEEDERDELDVEDVPQSSAKVINDDNEMDNEEDEYMQEGPSRATADGEEEFSFDNE